MPSFGLEPFFFSSAPDATASTEDTAHSPALFGVWRLPLDAKSTKRVWVVCPPFAEEEKSARRTLAEICVAFAEHKQATLLFSFRGTGDSGGDFATATLEDWRTDLRAACLEARRRFPALPLGLFGVRLGASLAYQLSAEVEAERLVCIEPILKGRQYLAQMGQRKRLRAMMTREEASTAESAAETALSNADLAHGIEDLDGWPLGTALREGLQQLDLQTAPSDFTGQSLVLQVGPREEIAVPLRRWADAVSMERAAGSIDLRSVVMQPFWNMLDYARADTLLETLENAGVWR